ncbi:MAG: mitochondrial fission ELM1 family protein [Thermomonas sp.]
MEQRSATDANDTPWTLADGRAGNQRQALALAAALGHGASRHWTLGIRAPWRWVAPREWPLSSHAFGAEFANALRSPPRFAIGCGRRAALAARLLRERGSKVVQILDPRIDTKHWDIVVAPEHDGLRGDNVVNLLGSLHPVDDPWLAQGRSDFPLLAQLPRPRVAVLVGGQSPHWPLADDAFIAMLDAIAAGVFAQGGSLLATASRRTPQKWRGALHSAVARGSGVCWTGAGEPAPAQAGGANSYPGLLGWADRIVCTADSVNMLSEACATFAPVFVLGRERLAGRPRGFVERLRELGRVRDADAGLEPFAAEPLRETARVAAIVHERLAL